MKSRLLNGALGFPCCGVNTPIPPRFRSSYGQGIFLDRSYSPPASHCACPASTRSGQVRSGQVRSPLWVPIAVAHPWNGAGDAHPSRHPPVPFQRLFLTEEGSEPGTRHALGSRVPNHLCLEENSRGHLLFYYRNFIAFCPQLVEIYRLFSIYTSSELSQCSHRKYHAYLRLVMTYVSLDERTWE